MTKCPTLPTRHRYHFNNAGSKTNNVLHGYKYVDAFPRQAKNPNSNPNAKAV